MTRPTPQQITDAIAKAVGDLIYDTPHGRASIGPIRVGVSKNDPDDWWDVKAPRAKRRVGNPAATVWVGRDPVVSVIASPNGKSILIVIPKGSDVEWVEA